MNDTKAGRVPVRNGIAELVLLAIAAVWLAVSFQSLNALVADSVKSDPRMVANLIMSLSGTITGAVFAGATAGNLVRSLWFKPFANLHRFIAGVLGGIVVGGVAAALSFGSFGGTPAVASIIASVTALFSVIGGLLSAARNRNVIFAGLAGMVVVLLLMFARGLLSGPIGSLLRDDPNSYRWIGIVAGVVIGMCGGTTAYLILRRRRGDTALYGYLGAGAIPGTLWMLSEIATRIAGALLVANTASPDGLSGLMMQQGLDAQLNGSMATLFAGATTAVLAFGLLVPGGKKGAAKKDTGNNGQAKKPKAEPTSPPTEAKSSTAAE